MSPETEKALERVRKLLALAGNNSNEHEAAAAAERAHAMLAEHNLTIGDVRTSGEADTEFVEDDDLVTTSQPWRRPLGTMVARMFFCEYLYDKLPLHRDRHSFIGQRHNVEVAKMFFTYLHMTVQRLAQDGALKRAPKARSAYRTEFRRTCSQRLCSRIYQRIEAAKRGQVPKEGGGGNLPALLDVYENTQKQLKAWVFEQYGEKGVTPVSSRQVATKIRDDEAALEGRKAGDAIGLDSQLGQDKPSGLIGN
jgi:hypothetical protein